MFTIKPVSRVYSVFLVAVSLMALTFSALGITPAHATFLNDIPGPPNSGIFGETVTVLPNGNFVVTDPYYPFYTNYTQAKGAVYFYSPNGVLISRLAGDRIGNSVGGGGITVLTNGDYVVNSPFWDSVTTDGVGAVTWCSQQTGCNGTVSAANSLVGGSNGDLVGFGGVIALANGNYVVASPHWFNGDAMWAGAVTWGNGLGGTKGVVSTANSLVGSSANDMLGDDTWSYDGGVVALTNGNYLVLDAAWDNGSVVDAGAITWGNGTGGTVGAVSAANSLVGTTAGDSVGDDFWGRVIELTNGNYVVVTPAWDLDGTHPDVGAVTWGSGTTGVVGPISISNSLVGASASAQVGDGYIDNRGVTALTNGNYVVSSPYWSPDGSASYLGAVTWGSGTSGVSGGISASNSLMGSHSGDYVGYKVIALTNGNYVVSNPDWALDDTNPYVGAVTWGNGTSGITGQVSASNSLVGRSLMSAGGGGVIALANGNYAVSSPTWSFETPEPHNVGAVTWGDGTSGTTGEISTSNSMVGINTYDSVGDGGLVALTNGNFIAISTGTWSGVPSVTWVNGSHVTTGVISAANSLVGSEADDEVGNGMYGGGVKALTNGNYVVISPYWDNGGITDAGAITWGDGTNGTIGVVAADDSLVGGTVDDRLGGDRWNGTVTILTNGNYVVSAPQWDNGSVVDAGAVTWGNGAGGTAGPVSASNSLVGSATGDMGVDGPFGGDFEVLALLNGNYIINSPQWSNVGSVTWGDGTIGTVGALSASNSLVNTCVNFPDSCQSTITALPDGNVSIYFPKWSNGSSNGAISLIADLPNITVGPVSTANSVLGTTAGIYSMVSGYDAARTQLTVGRPSDNIVTILGLQPGPTPGAFHKTTPANNAINQSTSLTLTWGASTGAAAYEYCYDTTHDSACSNWTDTGTVTSANLSGLTINTTHYWQIRAVNAGGTTYADGGAWWSFTTGSNSAPALTSPTDGSTLLTNLPTFTWETVNDAINYNIQVSTNSTFSLLKVNATTTTASYTPTTALTPKTKMYWRVRTKTGLSTYGPWSDVWSFTTANPPSAPTLSAPATGTLVTTSTVKLDWANVTMPAGTVLQKYEVQMATNSAFTVNMTLTDAAISEYTFGPLTPNTTYYWHVRAFNTLGQYSAWSASRTIRAAVLPPTLVTPLNAEFLKTRRPTFVWNSVPGATGYTIQISRNTGFTLLVGTYQVTPATYTPVADLPANTGLWWRVQSKGANGPSAWSLARSFHTANPPSTPALLLPAINALTTDYTPRLDWGLVTLPGGTTFGHYQVQVADNAAFAAPAADESGLNDRLVHEYSPTTDLNPNTKYYWRVRSYNAAGEYSAWSLVRTFRTALLPPTLQAPSNGDNLLYNRPTFDWDDVPGAIGYTIKISRNSGFTSLVGTYQATPATYTLAANLPANTTLWWRVQSKGANGPSAWSLVRSFHTANPPSVPTLLLPAINALTTDYTPRLDWAVVTVPVGTTFGYYRVQVDDDPAFGSPAFDVGSGVLTNKNVHEYTPDSDLNPNTKYYWRVSSYNGASEYSAWSLVRYFRTALSAPELSTPTDGGTTTLLRPPFDWADVSGAASYTIQVSRNSMFTSLVVNATVVPSMYTPTVNLPANITLYWRVKANGTNGPSLWSNIWTFMVVP